MQCGLTTQLETGRASSSILMPADARLANNRMKALVILLFGQSLALAASPWFTQSKESEFSADLLAADDIEIQSYRIAYSGAEGPWTLS